MDLKLREERIRTEHKTLATTWSSVHQRIALWVDDTRPMPDKYTMHVRTPDMAILILDTGLVSSISLDHDLGVDEHGRCLSGYDVALYIEAQAAENKCKRLTWAVHSANPVGRARIIDAMVSAERFWTAEEERLVSYQTPTGSRWPWER